MGRGTTRPWAPFSHHREQNSELCDAGGSLPIFQSTSIFGGDSRSILAPYHRDRSGLIVMESATALALAWQMEPLGFGDLPEDVLVLLDSAPIIYFLEGGSRNSDRG